jgi:hypothetical protein
MFDDDHAVVRLFNAVRSHFLKLYAILVLKLYIYCPLFCCYGQVSKAQNPQKLDPSRSKDAKGHIYVILVFAFL